jgi:uncharacterized protein
MDLGELHFFSSTLGRHVLVVDGSRIYDISDDIYQEGKRGNIDPQVRALTEGVKFVSENPPILPQIRSLSLNVAQSCNMSCTYCYADEGRFGGKARVMNVEIGKKAIDQFLDDIPFGSDALLGFMGGEPFIARDRVKELTKYSSEKAKNKKIRLRYSLTTNATLLKPEDIDLLSEFPFNVSVSLDGDRNLNDRLRILRSTGSAYESAVNGLRLLLGGSKRPMHVSIRSTVTPNSKRLKDILDHFFDLGVDSAGFSPVLVSPNPDDEFKENDFENFLKEMIGCGEKCKEAILRGERYPFSNFETAIQEIAKGTHRPYSCGAGAGYLSVNSEGTYYACHRTVDDPVFEMGNLTSGPEQSKRSKFLRDRHVLNQADCYTCWARFLCGGGCHHEVAAKGRPSCNYIRGWLEFCLSSYAEISERAPTYFADPEAHFKNSGGYSV